MNRHKKLLDQLKRAQEKHALAEELKSLAQKHWEINTELKNKLDMAFAKETNGQQVTQKEWDEMNELSSAQEAVHNEMAAKLRNR